MIDATGQVNQLSEAIFARLATAERVILAIAGPPGSGKSTLAAELQRRLQQKKTRAEVVPMDGFHLDNQILEARGLMRVKGAPETFDAHGFVHAMGRLAEGEEVILPIFDRSRDISLAGAVAVSPDCQVVIVEGNYLLFDEDPWRDLAPIWDLTVRLDVPMTELRARLIHRWLSLGFSRPVATRRAEANDIPNAERIVAKTLPAEFTF